MSANGLDPTDFGMQIVKKSETKIWYGGYGPDPYVYYAEEGPEKKFLGGCFLVETYGDLEKYSFANPILPLPLSVELLHV